MGSIQTILKSKLDGRVRLALSFSCFTAGEIAHIAERTWAVLHLTGLLMHWIVGQLSTLFERPYLLGHKAI